MPDSEMSAEALVASWVDALGLMPDDEAWLVKKLQPYLTAAYQQGIEDCAKEFEFLANNPQSPSEIGWGDAAEICRSLSHNKD